MFNIGDRVVAFGVEGVVVASTPYNVMCEFIDKQGVKEFCVFTVDGRLFEWASLPSLEKVE